MILKAFHAAEAIVKIASIALEVRKYVLYASAMSEKSARSLNVNLIERRFIFARRNHGVNENKVRIFILDETLQLLD